MKYTRYVNKNKYRMKIRIFTLFIFITYFISAQNSREIAKQLDIMGVSKDQAVEMAKQQGYSEDEINSELRLRSGDDKDTKNESEKNSKDIENNFDDINSNDSFNSNSKILDNDNNNSNIYFGYQIFKGDPSSFQSAAFAAVDPNYNIGPGDQIIVMLWGESQFRQEFIINREGYVFVPEVGQVFVNGLNLKALEDKLFQILSKVYSTLNPQDGEATTFMDISLGNLRPLRIIVLGEVMQPGAYSISPASSLSSSLYYFNGPSLSGSLRDIRLLRKGKFIGSIDFYDYLLSGKVPNDIRLQMDDVVYIPFRGKTVTILGEINRQGTYELIDNEDFCYCLYKKSTDFPYCS